MSHKKTHRVGAALGGGEAVACKGRGKGCEVGVHRVILAPACDVAVRSHRKPHKIPLVHMPCPIQVFR